MLLFCFSNKAKPHEDDEVVASTNDEASEPTEKRKAQSTRKRGRPATKNEAARVWTDEETSLLIDLWAQHENLFNTKHRMYFNRDARQKSIAAIEETLNSNNVAATAKQIAKKLTDLKNYFGAQKRMTESSKTSGAGTDEVFCSSWKFYDSLYFLNDAFTPRQTVSNASDEIEIAETPYENAKKPSSKSEKKIASAQKNEMQRVMSTAASALESIMSKRKIEKESAAEDEDDAFCNLLKKQLKLIPDCDAKDDLKLTVQQMVVSCKRHVKNASTPRQNPFALFSSSSQDSHGSFYGSPASNSSSVTSGC